MFFFLQTQKKKFNFLKLIFNTVDEMKNYQRLPSSFFNKQDEFQQQKKNVYREKCKLPNKSFFA